MARAKLTGENYRVINTLAAILAQISLKSSAAQKKLMGKEFSRAYEILTDSLAQSYAESTKANQLALEKLSISLPSKIFGDTPCPGVCCLGNPKAKTKKECELPTEGIPGIWICRTDRLVKS